MECSTQLQKMDLSIRTWTKTFTNLQNSNMIKIRSALNLKPATLQQPLPLLRQTSLEKQHFDQHSALQNDLGMN